MLLRLGCDLGQGWLYGPPVPTCDLPSFLSSPLSHSVVSSPEPLEADLMPVIEALPTQRLSQLQAIYDGAPVGLCLLDCNLRYVSINRHLAEMNGVPIADHLGRYVPDVIPDLFPKVEPYLRGALRGQAFNDLEIRSPKRNAEGHRRTLLLSYQPARDEANEIVGVSVVVIDITSRKLMEEALCENEALLRAIFDAVPVGLVISDAPSGSIIMSNPRAEAIFRRKIPIGENIDAYRQSHAFHPDGSCLAPEEYPTVRAIRTGEPTEPEVVLYQRGDDTRGWIKATAAPVRGKNGEIAGAVLALQDIDTVRRERQELLDRISTLESLLQAKS